jgi:hypothetical protein
MKQLIPNINEADPGNNLLFRKWQNKLHAAIDNTNACTSNEGILIEVAAQHPLLDGRYPNEEFSARLDAAIALYRDLTASNEQVKIYVPGSIHEHKGIADDLSLSKAGSNYLVKQGVPIQDIFGDDKNLQYKGDAGVYNSSDECYVAVQIFKDLDYRELHCFCSPAQLHRKALSYIAFGYFAQMHSVPVENLFHSYIDEVFLYIPRLLEDDNALQEDSEEADRLRALRKPK